MHLRFVAVTAPHDFFVQVLGGECAADSVQQRSESARALRALNQPFGLQFGQRSAGGHAADPEFGYQIRF